MARSKATSTTATPQPAPLRSVRADEVLSLPELARRLGWRRHSCRQAKRLGLPVIRFGSKDWVLGQSVLDFFGDLQRQQTGGRE